MVQIPNVLAEPQTTADNEIVLQKTTSYGSETYIIYRVCFVGKDRSLGMILSCDNAVQWGLFSIECTKGREKEIVSLSKP